MTNSLILRSFRTGGYCALLLTAGATLAGTQAGAGVATVPVEATEKKPVLPHNHMRDAKGMSISEKAPSAKIDAPSDVDKPAVAPEKAAKTKSPAKKKPTRPHSHPKDAKGM